MKPELVNEPMWTSLLAPSARHTHTGHCVSGSCTDYLRAPNRSVDLGGLRAQHPAPLCGREVKMSEADTAPKPQASEPTPEDLSKKISEAMKRSERLVKEALKLGRSLVGPADEDLRIRLR